MANLPNLRSRWLKSKDMPIWRRKLSLSYTSGQEKRTGQNSCVEKPRNFGSGSTKIFGWKIEDSTLWRSRPEIDLLLLYRRIQVKRSGQVLSIPPKPSGWLRG